VSELELVDRPPADRGLAGALRGSLHASTVTPLSADARVLATIDGEPAVVASRYGAGQTLFIGSYLGWGNHPEQHEAQHGVHPPARRLGRHREAGDDIADGRLDPPLVARLQENDDGYLLFLINHNADAQDITVSVRVRAGDYALTELVSEQQRSAAAQNGELRIETRVGGQDVNVWSLKRR
jgi:beta-galactosidase